MELKSVPVAIPEGANVIIGQAHFIKTVEDLYEAVAGSVPDAAFGLAFSEASGDRLVRTEGTAPALIKLAGEIALDLGAGHSFVLVLGNCFPIHVLNAVKGVQEVCTVFAASANRVGVVVAEADGARGILGVIDGEAPVGAEGTAERDERRALLRRFGYKLPSGP